MTTQVGIAPVGPYASPRQMKWHETEVYSLVHFSLNTYTDKEWGFGDESPDLFNPAEFDADQWVRLCQETGINGMILVAKHHDGFCLWPTKTTEHCVRNSSWRDGKGDVVKDVSEACARHGLKFGIYCSPWDRNNPGYGAEDYVNIYHEQLRELLTGYGSLFEFWFDGAHGGDGYYGGAYDRRSIGKDYYQWDTVRAMIRKYQPDACMFGIADLRFIGNEHGYAHDPCWATLAVDPFSTADGKILEQGERNGTHWMPGECDFPLREGWFYHEHDAVKQPDRLMDVYFKSVGLGCCMNIGLAPDRRGLICDDDAESLRAWSKQKNQIFSQSRIKTADAANDLSESDAAQEPFSAGSVLSDDMSFWLAGEGEKEPALVVKLDEGTAFNVIEISEAIEYGQRVDEFAVDVWQDGSWQQTATATSIGYKRLLIIKTAMTDQVRIRFTRFIAPPVIRHIRFYKASANLVMNSRIAITRNKEGRVSIRAGSDGFEIHYTTDGTEPDQNSPVYMQPLVLPDGGVVKAVGIIPNEDNAKTSVTTAEFGCDRSNWCVVRVSLESEFTNGGNACKEHLLNDDPTTYWHTYHTEKKQSAPPHEVVLDMGKSQTLAAITMMPRMIPGSEMEGAPDKYEVYLSLDGEDWTAAACGEFGNLKANPGMQRINLPEPMPARYIRFVATHCLDNRCYVVVAGIGAILAK